MTSHRTSHDLPEPSRRPLLRAVCTLPLLGLGACATLNQISCTVASFGNWPAGRAAGRFVFDRLPSQNTASAATEQQLLEDLAQVALTSAGFTALPAGQSAAAGDVKVQIGARISRQQRAPWDDPFWPAAWGPGWNRSPFARPRWHTGLGLRAGGVFPWPPADSFLREVALLLRDATTGEALFESRAATEGSTEGSDTLLGAMFRAAMQDFPQAQPEPHSVRVPYDLK